MAKESQKDWSWYSKRELEYYVQEKEQKLRLTDLELVKEAKKKLFLGDTPSAQALLNKISNTQTHIKLIKNYYLALIYFIKKDYSKAHNLIEIINDQYFSSQAKACFLDLSINLAKPVDTIDFKQQDICKQLLEFSEEANASFYWFEKMMAIKKGHYQDVETQLLQESTNLQTKEQMESWMKLAILIGQESIVRDRLLFTNKQITNLPEIRELSSIAYYNLGDFNSSYQAVEHLYSVNALNVKGSLKLKREEFKEAFSSFNKAYKINPFSETALEKLLALSVNLEKWKEGLSYLKSLPNQSFKESMASYLLKAIFYQQTNQYQKAKSFIKDLSSSPKTYHSPLTQQLKIINAYSQQNLIVLKESSKEACYQYDAFSCWIFSQVLAKEEFKEPLYETRSGQSYSQRFQSLIEGQKDTSPLDYQIIIDQKDIEELDAMEEKLL